MKNKKAVKIIKNVECVLWDWNGTLIDDIDVAVDVLSQTIRPISKVEITKNFYLENFKFPVIDFYKKLGIDVEKHWDYMKDSFLKNYMASIHRVRLFEDVPEVLALFKKLKISMAVLSAMHEQTLLRHVEKEKISHFFSHIKGAEDVEAAGKVSYSRKLLKKMGAEPEKTVLVGDTLHDSDVAEKSGCRCVLISRGHNSKQRLEKSGRIVLDSLSEFSESIT